jgi:hypothetical protein
MKFNPITSPSFFYDFSYLLHRPAGKYGHVKVKEDLLVFDNGQEIRFLGVNIVGANCFPSKQKAVDMATQLAQMGCNLVRLHHLDAPWARPNIFGNATNTTRVIDSVSIDLLDYFIYQLKEAGIYIYMDLLVHREFLPEDGISISVPHGGKQAAFTDKTLIHLQKEYIYHLLHHHNSYTNTNYINETSIVGVCLINESSSVVSEGNTLPSYYRERMEQDFKSKNHDSELSIYEINYATANPGIRNVNNGNDKQSLFYYVRQEQDYYLHLKDYLHQIGFKGLVSGSNFPYPILTSIKSNMVNDVIIANAYWDHPKIHLVNNDWTKINEAPIDNLSQLRFVHKNLIHRLSKFRIFSKPFLVTEFAQPYPNEYKYEVLSLMVLYGLFQGWNGWCQFEYSGSTAGIHNSTSFDISAYPDLMATWAIMASVFHHKKIKKGEIIYTHVIDQNKIYTPPSTDEFLDRYSFLPFITAYANTFEDNASIVNSISDFSSYMQSSTGSFSSTTRELVFHSKQQFIEINSHSVQGLLGTLQPGQYSLRDIEIEIYQRFEGLILCTSIEDEYIENTCQVMLAVISNTTKEGYRFNPNRKVVQDPGSFPYCFNLPDGVIRFKRTIDYLYFLPEKIEKNMICGHELSLQKVESMISTLFFNKVL